MDTGVALVQAYLHVNGYFTVTEFPVLEALHPTEVRNVTDLDILAFRFPGAGEHVVRGRTHAALSGSDGFVDPALGAGREATDMIVGEVKEGPARLNRAMRDPVVIAVALARFGCCSATHAREVTGELLAKGHATTPEGHSIRIVAFGDAEDGEFHTGWTTVPMRHVVEYLQDYLGRHWTVMRHAQFHDPAFATLALLEKWKVGDRR